MAFAGGATELSAVFQRRHFSKIREATLADQGPTQPPTVEASGEIRNPQGVVTTVILPVAMLLILFIGVLVATPHFAACENYYIIKLVYPFLFGSLGLVLGGTISIDGEIPFLGEKSRMRAAGGIAGAIVGFAIAHFAQPTECEAKHALILKGFPTSGSVTVVHDGIPKTRAYIGLYDTTSTSVATIVERTNDVATRDLKFKFGAQDKSKDGFKIVLSFYRADLTNSQKFEYAFGCRIEAKIEAPPAGAQKFQLIASEALRYEVHFNPNFFKEVEETLKKGAPESEVMCLKGRSKLDGDGPLIEARVAVPFYVTRLKSFFGQELWYVVETQSTSTNQSAARQTEVVNGELSVGEKAPPSPSVTPTVPSVSPDTAIKPARQVTGCKAPDPQRVLIDRFISGDDLDANARKDLYQNLAEVYCYVWPLVKNASNANERARAIKFAVNAIINNSLEKSNPSYWQPTASNKRDFSKSLPLLSDSDYRLIFDLLKSDDLPVRTESTRFVRNLPVDKFGLLFNEQVEKQEPLTSSQRERLAIAAAFFHYGRIVEWLDESTEQPSKVVAAVSADFRSASKWITKAALGESAKAYEAMLWYAKAIVDRERIKNDETAKTSFRQVIECIAVTSEPYPSNPLHLAQAAAVAFTADAGTALLILREIRTADKYSSSNPLPSAALTGSTVLNAGPGDTYKRQPNKTFTGASGSRLLLRKNDWLFVQSGDQIGWIKRDLKSS